MHENLSKAAMQSAPKRRKTMETYNANRASGMAVSGDQWKSDELKKLLKAVKANGRVPPKSGWQPIADAVGSRTATQCEHQYADLKRAKRLDPISEDTPLREGIFTGFGKPAFKKFAECVAEIDGKRITTVGQLAALDLDISKEANKLYLQKLTGYKFMSLALKMAAPWKEKAAEAIEFWQ